jgi:hypothetical protein
MGHIDLAGLDALAESLKKSTYGEYLVKIVAEEKAMAART